MNAIELLKKAEITKEDFKHEVVFKTLFNLINEMICEEDKLENEYHKLKQNRDTWEHISQELIKEISPFGTLPVSHPKVEALINDLISEKEKYRQQRNLLNEKISNLLIAIEKGYVTIFPESELTPDYIQDLEDVQKQIIKESVFNRA